MECSCYNMDSSRVSDPRGRDPTQKWKPQSVFYNLLSEVTCCRFYYIIILYFIIYILVTYSTGTVWEGTI